MTTPYEKFDQSLAGLDDSLTNLTRYVHGKDDLTDKGKDEYMDRATTRHKEHLAKLNAAAQEMEDQAVAAVDKVRATILPTPQDDTQALAAEMQASRILNRPGMDDASTALQWIQGTPPSPARTVVLEELQARGVLKPEYVDGALVGAHPEYAQARQGVTQVRTVLNNVYRPHLANIEHRLNYRRTEGTHIPETPATVRTGLNSSVMGGDLPNLNVPVAGWTNDSTDNLLANQ